MTSEQLSRENLLLTTLVFQMPVKNPSSFLKLMDLAVALSWAFTVTANAKAAIRYEQDASRVRDPADRRSPPRQSARRDPSLGADAG